METISAASVRSALRSNGFRGFDHRRGIGGFVVTGGARDAMVFVSYRLGDSEPESDREARITKWNRVYTDALKLSGLIVDCEGSSLTVSKA